jgi:hypothetical protein
MKTTKKVLVLLLVLAGAAHFLYQGSVEYRQTCQLLEEGKSVTGKVHDERTVYRSRGRTRYYLTLEYEPKAGCSYQREFQVDYHTHQQGARDGEMTVWYVPSEPQISQAGAHPHHDFWNFGFGVLFALIAAALTPGLWRPTTRRELADKVSEGLEVLCDTDVRYAPVEAAKYPHLNLAFYERLRQQFEEHGFVHLEDIEEIRAKPMKGFPPTFLRVMLSRDGTRIGVLFHVKPGWALRLIGAKEMLSFGVETVFSNETSVGTDNADKVTMLDPVPGFNELHLPATSTLEMILEAQERRVAGHAAQNPGAIVVRVHSPEQLHALMLAANQRRAAFRRQHGLSKQSLERLGGVTDNPVINDLHADLTVRIQERDERDRKSA